MKHLLIVYHSQTGKNESLARAVWRGVQREPEIEARLLRASAAETDDLLWADAVIFAAPENFGYLAGGLTDFFARTFYPYLDRAQTQSLPYAMVCGTGNDGSGALRQLRRIVTGYRMREVAEPIFVVGELEQGDLQRCEELGLTLAAGLAMGIF